MFNDIVHPHHYFNKELLIVVGGPTFVVPTAFISASNDRQICTKFEQNLNVFPSNETIQFQNSQINLTGGA